MVQRITRDAFSLTELMAVIVLIGITVTIVLTRASTGNDNSNIAACYVNKGDIEIQAELWLNNSGSWPLANLSDVGGDVNYFPEGVPLCPVDGTVYTIDTSTGRVIGHNH